MTPRRIDIKGILSDYEWVVMYDVGSLQQISIFISVKSDIRRVVNEKCEFYGGLSRYMIASVLKKNIDCWRVYLAGL
jgi:hypothetical protein